MSKRVQGLLMFAVAVALIYPAFLVGTIWGDQAAELLQAIAERPYSVLVGVVVNLFVLGFLLWLVSGQTAVARTVSGASVTSSQAEEMQAEILGHATDYWVSDTEFRVTLTYPSDLPADRLDAFVALNNGGYPFLLGFIHRSCGVEVAHNTYINLLLWRDLQELAAVTVREVAGQEERTYAVPLRHSFG